MQSIGVPQTQMLRRSPDVRTRRDGNTTLALNQGDLLRDLGVERTHGITPGGCALLGEKKKNNSRLITLLCRSGLGPVNFAPPTGQGEDDFPPPCLLDKLGLKKVRPAEGISFGAGNSEP